MTKHEDEKILKNIPDGATHVDSDGDYCKVNGGHWDSYNCDSKTWFDYEEAIPLRSLADIKELVRLRKENAELKRDLATAEKVLLSYDVSRKEGAIRDLEQQLKTADSFINMSQVSGRFGRGAISENDAIRKRNKIFKELSQLKERTK